MHGHPELFLTASNSFAAQADKAGLSPMPLSSGYLRLSLMPIAVSTSDEVPDLTRIPMHLDDSLDFFNFIWPPNFLAPSLGPWNELGSQGILVIFVDLCISRWGSRLLCLLRAKWSRSKDTCYPPTLVDNFIYSKSVGGRIWSRTHHINGGCYEEFVV